MPTPTYTLLDSVTLTSSASSVTFSSISAAGKGDLVLSASLVNGHGSPNGVYLRFNSDTGSNYPLVRMVGNGSTAVSESYTFSYVDVATLGVASSSSGRVQISDFAATDKHKSILVRRDISQYNTIAQANRWASTSPITSMLIYPSSNSFIAGDAFHLYQIVSE